MRSPIQTRQSIKRILGACAVTVVAAVSTGSMSLAGAGTALAPEPARLNGQLNYNSYAAAHYVNTSTPTTAYAWSSGWAVSSLPVGAPCFAYNAVGPAGQRGETTTKVIQGYSNMRACR